VAAGLLCVAAGALGRAAQAPAPAQLSAEDARARDTLVRVCSRCHPIDRITTEGRSRTQWENTIVAMQMTYAAPVTPDEFTVVLDYLTKFHSRSATPTPAELARGRGAGGRGAGGRGQAAAGGRATLGPRPNVGAADRHRVDPAAAARGQKLYAAQCVTCHGASARGTERGANLIRSTRMLRDRYGSAIGPFLKAGHPTETGTGASLTDAQITDISHFIWDRINSTLRGAPEFDVKDVLTGDAAAGRAYFTGAGGCAACHSPTGDLAGIGARYEPVDIQQRFVFPSAGGRGGRGAKPRPQLTITVTLPGRAPVSGVPVNLDDFHVALRDAAGVYHSWVRTPDMTIQKTDPYAAHVALLDRLTDKEMHDVTAYLASLQ
jgi:mono/diheme cytochrome c family protein